MNSTKLLESSNEVKFTELREALTDKLRDLLAEKDLEVVSLEDDELLNIESALLRTKMMIAHYDLQTALMPESDSVTKDDDSGAPELFDAIVSLASRGRLGYRQEVKVGSWQFSSPENISLTVSLIAMQIVQYSMSILLLFISWKMKKTTLESIQEDERLRDKLQRESDIVARVYEQYAISGDTNAPDAVRRDVRIAFTKDTCNTLIVSIIFFLLRHGRLSSTSCDFTCSSDLSRQVRLMPRLHPQGNSSTKPWMILYNTDVQGPFRLRLNIKWKFCIRMTMKVRTQLAM